MSHSGTHSTSSRKDSTPIRRRISRACDRCNQLRTKCDGQNPCAHCIESGLTCGYARERKKRGKASRKDLMAAVALSLSNPNGNPSCSSNAAALNNHTSAKAQPQQEIDRRGTSPASSVDHARPLQRHHLQGIIVPGQSLRRAQQPQQGDTAGRMAVHSSFATMSDPTRQSAPAHGLRSLQMLGTNSHERAISPILPPQGHGTSYNDTIYTLMSPQDPSAHSMGQFRRGASMENHPAQLMGLGQPVQTHGWLNLPSPLPASSPAFGMTPLPSSLKYPVLQPVLPHIACIIPQSLACDLLDVYFTSLSPFHLSPQSPYVVGYIFRKQSFLHRTRPRVCSSGLLASMLWVAAQTSDAAFLTSPPSARGRVCQKLLELTVSLLRPLIHGPAPDESSPNYPAKMVINGVALGGFGVSMDQFGAQSCAAGTVDDVATYIHLATVISASEYKAASMRWWMAAWTLARELKLGRELRQDGAQNRLGESCESNLGLDASKRQQPSILPMEQDAGAAMDVFEEEREERRRVWWLLYAMDRHLALCYNRPLTLLDKECESLLQPMDDDLWQAGNFTGINSRAVGPPSACTGHSMFGYFLPLMGILGEIVDIQQAQTHPRFGRSFRDSRECNSQVIEITRQLDSYRQSLREFEARHTSSLSQGDSYTAAQEPCISNIGSPGRSSSVAGRRTSESIVHTKTVVAYGTHIMHVLHILLAGKWDPINLLDGDEHWISSESFVSAMGHAISAAEAAADILEYDPELNFMPFFFGIYLLQGSFLLLLTADKMQGEGSPIVTRACETIIRAHEACVVTLNTEYQRNFRKVMRSALAQVQGRVPEDYGEQQRRRREVLALYRWTGDGGGLAL